MDTTPKRPRGTAPPDHAQPRKRMRMDDIAEGGERLRAARILQKFGRRIIEEIGCKAVVLRVATQHRRGVGTPPLFWV